MRLIVLFLPCFILSYHTVRSQDDITRCVKKIKPAVVSINTYDKNHDALLQGTGFFIDKNKVVSNSHVFKDAVTATITTIDKKVYIVKGKIDENVLWDLIVVETEIPTLEMTPLELDPQLPDIASQIFVLGSPLGYEQTFSDGRVSAIRSLENIGSIIQITAPISHGSSGSPVLNSNCKVIGVVTLTMEEGQNINFAVPSEHLVSMMSSQSHEPDNTSWITNADSLYYRGIQYAWVDDFARAEPYFRNALDIDSNLQEGWLYLGYCQSKLGKYELSIKSYTKALEFSQKDSTLLSIIYNNLGVAFDAIGRSKDAIQAYEKAIRYKPSSLSYRNLGVVCDKLEDFVSAENCFKKALQLDPNDTLAILYLADVYGSQKKYPIAIDTYKTLLKKCPQYAQAWAWLGGLYFDLERYDEAIKCYEQVRQINPNDSTSKGNIVAAYNNWGLLYEKDKKYSQAISVYKQALQINPNDLTSKRNLIGVYNNWGVEYQNKSEYSQAINAYEQALQIDSHDSLSKGHIISCYYNWGIEHQNNQKYPEGLSDYSKVIELDPDNFDAYHNRGDVLIRMDRSEDAMKDLKKALQLKPNFAEAYFSIGDLYFNKGKYQEAIIEGYQQAIRIQPNYPVAVYYKAVAYSNLGQKEQACKDYEVLRKLDTKQADELKKVIKCK